MEKQIELEYIGQITPERFNELEKIFKKNGVFKKKKERISFMYFRNKIPRDIKEIKNEETDLRIRITNKEPELIIKKGLFTASHARKEISLTFPLNETENYIDFLNALGWNIGVIYAVETKVYEYQGIEFSLVNIEGHGYNFEAEIMTSKKDEKTNRDKIESVLKELNLKSFDEEELDKQCNQINNREHLKFDFSKQSFKEIQEKFSRFF
jgi:CYTH domain-containing protein